MKCYADDRDYCRTPIICAELKDCYFFPKENKMIECVDKNGCLYQTQCKTYGKCTLSMTVSQVVENKPRIPEFIEILEASKAIHLKKNADYASESNPFSNFERSAQIIEWFKSPQDKSFIALIATKLARIAELSDGRSPNNESLDDSFLDLVTYCGLWAAYSKRMRGKL